MGRQRDKAAGDENFPVGSWLIERRLRRVVRAYYAAARTADDVADSSALTAEEKLDRLDRFEAALAGRSNEADVDSARQARLALLHHGVPLELIARLLRAFRRDAIGRGCEDWNALADYCSDSANPVGRFLLLLHGEPASAFAASDALCTALQVINHLQDCGDDWRTLGRVYLPADWMAAEGVRASELGAGTASDGLRRVLDRCLVEVDTLLSTARPLPALLRSTRLALEAAVVLRLAEVLARELKRRDPLAEPVRLSRPAMVRHSIPAVLGCIVNRGLGRRPAGRQLPA